MFVALSTASHYRGGSITWAPVSATDYNIINFKVELAFRRDFSDFNCNNNYPVTLGEYIIGCSGTPYTSSFNLGSLDVGDYSEDLIEPALINSMNSEFFTASVKFTYAYPKYDGSYEAIFSGQARINELIENGGKPYYIMTKVIIQAPTASEPLNTSPVINTYPVITATNGYTNTFTIQASDLESPSKQLVFSLADPEIMGGSYSYQYQPEGLTISPSGVVSFKPNQLGIYNAQVMVTDPQGAWVVADFLINSVVVSMDPPFFIAPTPDETKPITCQPLTECTWTYAGKTNIIGKSVVISVAYLPSGVVQGEPTGGQTVTIVNTWRPTVAQTGRYVVNLNLKDTSDPSIPMIGQRSFVIVVQPPPCGNGNVTQSCTPSANNNCCTCDDGWDPNSQCYECLPHTWGPKCKPDPKCVQGTPSTGPAGDGSCLCFLGYTGPLCDVSISARCDPEIESGILSAPTSQGYIQPASAQVFLGHPSVFPYTVTVPMPNPLPSFDIYFLIEIGSGSANSVTSYKNYIANLISKLAQYGEGGSLGFGYYSYSAAGGIIFQHVLSIGSSVIDDIKATVLTNSGQKNPAVFYDTLEAAASYSVGWRMGSHRTMMILGVTDSATTSNPADWTNTYNILKQRFIMPLFVSVDGDDLPNIRTAFTNNFGSFKIGTRKYYDPASAQWTNDAYNLFTQATSGSIKPYVVSDSNSFVSGSLVPTYDTSNGRVASFIVGILLPTPVPSAQASTILISVIGFGTASIVTQYNHAPTGLPATVTLYEDSSKNFTLASYVSDSDSNVLTVEFPSVSTTIGIIKLSDGQPCSSGFPYPSTQGFKFVPNTNANGATEVSFTVNDGCKSSVSVPLKIVINPVNDLPTCSAYSGSATMTSPALFTLTGADIDDQTSTLSVVLDSLATASTLGQLTVGSGNTAAVAGTIYPIATQFKFKPTTNPATTSSASFTFTIKDVAGGVSTRCTASVSIGHVNVAPTVTSSATVTVTPNSATASVLTLQASDIDSTSVTFVLSSIVNHPVAATDGMFVNCADNTPITSSTTIPAVNLVSGSATTTICYKAPVSKPANGLNYASITFLAMDNEGLPSSTFTIAINVIGDRVNTAPTAIGVNAISLDQDTVSASFTLDGTDPDLDDQGKLNSLFTTPANGVLLLASAPVTSSQGKAPLVLQYRPNPGFVGTDSFTFKVSDTFGATSDDKTVSFTVKFVNHAPTVLINSYTFTQINHPIQTVHVTDNDANSVVSCKVTTLPTTGSLTDSADTVLKVGDVITTFKCLEPTPSPQTAFDTTFSVNCCDEFTLCASATGDIHYSYVNQPPQSLSSKVETEQAVDKSFTFEVTDETASSVKILLASLPVHGQLKLANGTVITSLTNQLQQTLIYSPDPKLSNADTPGGAGPLDQITFYAVDAQGLQSQVAAVVEFSVIPKPPPYYDGLKVFQTLEDTILNLHLEAHAGDNSKNVELNVLDVSGPSQGSLFKWVCSEDGCIRPVAIGDTISNVNDFQLRYIPPKDKFGNQFFNLSFTMTSNNVTSERIDITINVNPVNDPPTFVLVEPLELTFTIPMNSSQVISWTATDVDDSIYTLGSNLALRATRGSLYQYDAANVNGNFIGAQIIDTQGYEFPLLTESDPFWRVVFVPTPGQSGLSYAWFGFGVQDFRGGFTAISRYTANVSPINVPPVVNVNQTNWNVSSSSTLLISGVSVHDADSVNNNITITVSIVNGENIVQEASNLTLSGNYNEACISEPGLITCINKENVLNYYLAEISASLPSDGTFYLRVFVDDLGYNAFPALRNVSHLTDTKDLTISVSSAGVKKTTNTTVLSAAIAGAAVAAAIIAIGIWRLLKRAAPPTDAFFGDSPFSDASVSANPLYQESGNTGTNPLYEQTA
eukprot:gene8669-10179_t